MNRSSAHSTTRVYARCESALEDLQLDGGGAACIVSRRSPAKLTANEDAAAILAHRDAVVLAVADGLGGKPGGAEAAQTAMRTLRDALGAGGGAFPDTAVPAALEAANHAVIAHDPGGATTLAVVVIRAGIAHAYHVGDAGVLVVGDRGRIRLQTIAHSPVGYALEAGLLDERAAMSHGARHFVSNVIGDPEMRIEASAPVRLQPRDTVLIASDGLFDNMFTDEIVALIRGKTIGAAVRGLGDACIERMEAAAGSGTPRKPDDLTVVGFSRKSTRRR